MATQTKFEQNHSCHNNSCLATTVCRMPVHVCARILLPSPACLPAFLPSFLPCLPASRNRKVTPVVSMFRQVCQGHEDKTRDPLSAGSELRVERVGLMACCLFPPGSLCVFAPGPARISMRGQRLAAGERTDATLVQRRGHMSAPFTHQPASCLAQKAQGCS